MKTIRLQDHKEQPMSDSEVIRKILGGEKELYELLMRRNNQKVYRAVRSYVKDEEEIQDVMQETYLKGYEKLYQFKQDAQFSTWLIRIAINESLSLIRSKGKQAKLFDPSNASTTTMTLEIPDSEQLNPEKNIIRQEAKRVLEKAIDALQEKYRVVYILKEVEDLNIAEIAACLQVTESNVKVRLHRARIMIKEGLYELSQSKDVFEFGFKKCDRLVDAVMQVILEK
ncbi:MAG TPA: RNA polymerase sigma factor [Cytophagaceae bacterium]|jgi:RNA polymerase sigma factor (sigma-70 family)|nr:RNA polymerase sigma factor [Cytophagaceae bacterium]